MRPACAAWDLGVLSGRRLLDVRTLFCIPFNCLFSALYKVFIVGDEKRLDSFFFFDKLPVRPGKGYIKNSYSILSRAATKKGDKAYD